MELPEKKYRILDIFYMGLMTNIFNSGVILQI